MRKWAVDPKLIILSERSLSDVTEGTQCLSQVSEIIPRCFVWSSGPAALFLSPCKHVEGKTKYPFYQEVKPDYLSRRL